MQINHFVVLAQLEAKIGCVKVQVEWFSMEFANRSQLLVKCCYRILFIVSLQAKKTWLERTQHISIFWAWITAKHAVAIIKVLLHVKYVASYLRLKSQIKWRSISNCSRLIVIKIFNLFPPVLVMNSCLIIKLFNFKLQQIFLTTFWFLKLTVSAVLTPV